MTETKNTVRRNLIRRINALSPKNLYDLENYLNRIEEKNSPEEDVMSYAGIFKDLDSDLFRELTDDLHENRNLGRTRIL